MRVIFGVIAVAAWACAPDLDVTRTPDTHSFGERVVTLICKRIAFQAEPTDVRGDHYRETCNGGEVPAGAPPALVALVDSRPSLVKAIDSAVPADFTADLQAFLTSDATLALYDNDTMSNSIATLADLLDEIAHDDAALAALAHASVREGYRPAETAFGVPAALASARASVAAGAGPVVPSLHAVLAKTVPAITSGGAVHDEWDALVAALSATLLDASAPSDVASPERTATLAADFFLSERADLTEPSPELLVRRDPRGIARIALVGGAVPEPFVDANHDKLADVDALGRFIDAQGRPIATAAPFATAGDAAPRDPEGRVGTFAYVDLGKTVIGALGHDAAQLFDPATGMALDLARGASALLGPRVMTSHAFPGGASLPYLGYDTTQSPLLDMTYGFAQLLRDPNVRDLLGLADTLLADHDAAAARLIEAAIATARVGDAHPEAQIVATAPMWDDLMPLVRQIVARPQLVRALFAALDRPEVKQLGQRFSDLMTYADRFDLDPVTQAVTGSFSRKPDRTKPDDALNRSLFQRFLHLINDSNRVRLCNKDGATIEVAGITYPPFGLSFGACNLIQIDNLATFFVRAVAYEKSGGNVVCEDAAGDAVACTTNGARPRPGATLVFKDSLVSTALDLLGDDFLEGQARIVGFRRHPTPEALTRVLFLSPMPAFLSTVLDPVRDRDGDLYQGQHGGTLPVLEKNNFYDQIRPIIQAFADSLIAGLRFARWF